MICRGDNLPFLHCGDGWYQLIADMMDKLEPMAHNVKDLYGKEPKLYRIESRKGAMNVIIDDVDMAMDEIIMIYQDRSESICETCGEPGTPNGNGWIEVMCKGCASQAGRA